MFPVLTIAKDDSRGLGLYSITYLKKIHSGEVYIHCAIDMYALHLLDDNGNANYENVTL